MKVGRVPWDARGRLCSWGRELGTLPTLFPCLCGIPEVLRSGAQMNFNIPDTIISLNIHLVFTAASRAKDRS